MEWRPAAGWETDYSVSERGDVRRETRGNGTRPGRIKTPSVDKEGYLIVGMPGKRRVPVHRLVATTFHGPSELPLVRHLDGDKTNNHFTNLQWGTWLENMQDRALHGRNTGWHSKITVCKRGHAFTEENTILRGNPDGRIHRVCRVCKNAAQKRRKSRSKT